MDADLVINVLSRTVFSPMFAIWVPIFYISQRLAWTSPTVINSFIYFGLVATISTWRFVDSAWRNGTIFRQKVDWGEQVVVITGGAGGIGGLLANTLAMRGVTVAVLDVKPLETENSNITSYKCDISNWAEVEAVSAQIVEELGHPTILVNNAGVVQGKLITDLTEKDVKETVGVNLLSHFWTLKAFLPDMIKQKTGHVVTVASAMGIVGVAQMSDYNATKAALINLNESLRCELEHIHQTPKIRTSLVITGYVTTPMFSKSSYGKLSSNYFYRFFVPGVQPNDIVKDIIKALDAHESREVLLPYYVNILRPAVALAPSWLRDILQWISQADYMMRDFAKGGERAQTSASAEGLKTR
ncbi:hypothetical protein FRB95_002103 [Tulasnella sp. JGI-2019a]|nr:hypothetical protein FRB95_002103 [Tulasnella sp. JGI-2019a]